ncbi:MAG: apolipoprotein N-acyltransferase [Phycisphaerae bacterium]|nr:apolipoprotein N-acyltransferase [Phycisphaerae bacterium]
MLSGRLTIKRRWPVFALVAATLALQSLIHAPYAVWPLAYVCLVPWLIVVAAARRPGTVYLASYLLGAAFFLVNLRWLWYATGAGYIAASLYCGIYYLIAAWAIRHMHRRRGVPLAFLVPVVWVMAEFIRSHTAAGFPWFLLGHSHYRILSMIQISDLVGAYGLSFVLAAANGWLAGWLVAGPRLGRDRATPRSRSFVPASVFVLALIVGTFVYGRFRLAQSEFTPGPKVAVLQGDFILEATKESETTEEEKRDVYRRLLAEAAVEGPDLFLLPETPWMMNLNREYRELGQEVPDPSIRFARECHDYFVETAAREDAYIVVGSASLELHPKRVYPRYERFNSAFVYAPGEGEPRRYDKIHLVLFGEYVPFRYGRLHSLYRKLNAMTPWGAGGFEYSLTAGTEHTVFDMRAKSLDDRAFHFAVPICYEDVIPDVNVQFVTGPDGNKRVDFLLNISNDGWFWHSHELPQHLAICAFRAVENRVGIARAVNTGCSGFIDPDGRIRDLVSAPGRQPWEGITGWRVSHVNLDARHSVYSQWGDWFAILCTLLGVACLAEALAARVRANWFRHRHAEA